MREHGNFRSVQQMEAVEKHFTLQHTPNFDHFARFCAKQDIQKAALVVTPEDLSRCSREGSTPVGNTIVFQEEVLTRFVPKTDWDSTTPSFVAGQLAIHVDLA